jgi:hypothetical protein
LPNTAFARDWPSIVKINAGELLEDDISRWGKRKDAGECANKFVDEFIAIQTSTEQSPTGVPKEKLLAQLFNTITKLQNIN